MKVKRYELKPNTTIKDLLKCGAIEDRNFLYIDKFVEVKNSDIRIRLSFTSDVNKWNDVGGVEVFNTDSGQSCRLFYKYRDSGEDAESGLIEYLISEYNIFMDSLPIMISTKSKKK